MKLKAHLLKHKFQDIFDTFEKYSKQFEAKIDKRGDNPSIKEDQNKTGRSNYN